MSYFNDVKGNWGTAVKTSAGYNWRNSSLNSNCDSGLTFIRTVNAKGSSTQEHGGQSKGYITGKGRIRVGNLDFDSVSFVKELGHFNLFSISQICDKHHKVLFTETECLVVSPDFKMPDENQILLKVPRQHNMYSFDMKTHSLTKDYACLIAKATSDESKLWHRRFCWVFFLAKKDETSGILQNFIRQIENQLNHRVKIIRSDNGTEFKKRELYLNSVGNKGIKTKSISMPELTDVNGVAERMNRTLIEAAKTMLADSLLPTTFWAKAVSTACYIFNRVLQRPRKSSTNSKEEKFLTELQNLQTQEKEAFSTGISEDTPEILAFRRDLDQLAQKHLREVTTDKATSTNSVNSGFTNIHLQSQILGDPKSSVQTRSRLKQTSGAHALVRGKPKKIFKALKMTVGWLMKLCKTGVVLQCRRTTERKDIMLVQVYVDDIIFGSTRKSWCDEFEALMKGRFQMSSMGELIFFLGLQVTKTEEFSFLKTNEKPGDVDAHLYRSMIGSLMYLTASRPDIMFAVKSTTEWWSNFLKQLNFLAMKEQTILAYSTKKVKYVAAEACVGHLVWIQIKVGMDQFGSKLATALICLSTGRTYNFSKMIFEAMVANCTKVSKSFAHVSQILSIVLEAKPVNTNLYLAYQLTKKIFGNMNRGFAGVYRPLLANMIAGHDENQSEPQEEPVESQPPPNASVPSTSQPTTEPHPDQELETKAGTSWIII
ncbi:ribonuclease H-like domain-containing protein [Tanacetum coccineum]